MHSVVTNILRKRFEISDAVTDGEIVDFDGSPWIVFFTPSGPRLKPSPGDPEPEPERYDFAALRATTRVDTRNARAGRKMPDRVIPDWVSQFEQGRLIPRQSEVGNAALQES